MDNKDLSMVSFILGDKEPVETPALDSKPAKALKKAKPKYSEVNKDMFMSALMEQLITLHNKAKLAESEGSLIGSNFDIMSTFRNLSDSLLCGDYSINYGVIKSTCKSLGFKCSKENINEVLKRG